MENNNNYSSVKDQARKGLSTFVLTLSISLIVFSTIYYLMTTKSSEPEESYNPVGMVTVDEENNGGDVKGKSSESTVFGDIASADPNTSYGQVLAGADEADDTTTATTTTTVTQTTQSNSSLNTGVTSITIGLVFALVLFIATLVFVSRDPRKFALSTFEKKTTKGL